MPRRVDHEQRRRTIAEAVWRIAADRGLEDVTMRRVAEAAGVSTRLVQYYFGTRDDLLVGALTLLSAAQQQDIEARIPADAAPRTVLRAILVGMLPLGDFERTALLVQIAYFVRSLGDERLAAAFRAADEPTVADLFAQLLAQAAERGELAPGLDLRREAQTLVAVPGSFGVDLLLELHTEADVLGLIDYHLDRIFTR